MKIRPLLRVGTALLTLGCLLPTVFSQLTPDEPLTTVPPFEETVILSPFEISANQPARYQAAEAASGGRIRMAIMDTPTSVTVLTNEFLEDIGSSRFRDAAKYVAGISESTFPNAQDRVNIRGFQSQGRRIDGFSTFTQSNYDSAAIDRMEVIKGPDAVLQPAGVPGGTINLVSKRPQFVPGGYVKAQFGEYDANRIEADITGPFANGRLAYRLIAAFQDSEGYVKRTFRESLLISPSLSWRLSPQSLLTFRYEYLDADVSANEGIPVDPSVGTTTGFKTMEGIPLDFNPAADKKYAHRGGETHALSFHFSAVITDKLSVRLAGRLAEVDQPESGFGGWGMNTLGGSINPYSGNWDPGVTWVQPDPAVLDFVPTPAPTFDGIFNHFGTHNFVMRRERDIQNDWAYIIDTVETKSTTLLGFAYNYLHTNIQTRTERLPDFTVEDWTPPGAPIIFPPSRDSRGLASRYQTYLTETLELFNRRLTLSGGVSHLSYSGMSVNRLSAGNPPLTVPGQAFGDSASKSTYNYGVVVKPREVISLYYGHSENAAPTGSYEQISQGTAPSFEQGKQDEFGVKTLLFGGKMIASVAYYEIEQTGYGVWNPGNAASPPPEPPLPNLILNRKARGWEYQITGNITQNLAVIASYDDMKNRDPNGVVLRGTPEQNAAAFVRYSVTSGVLKGFAIGVGANYASKAAGDIPAAGFTRASTPDNIIPNQPTFYLPSRTVGDLYFSYTHGALAYRIDVRNFTDELYYGSLGRRGINVANPRNFSGSVTWRF